MSVRAGERLRHHGQQLTTHAADSRHIAWIDAVIRGRNATGLPWSANDVRDAFPVASQGLVGARVDAARKRGEMEWVGYTKSTLTSTRGAKVCVWRGKAAS